MNYFLSFFFFFFFFDLLFVVDYLLKILALIDFSSLKSFNFIEFSHWLTASPWEKLSIYSCLITLQKVDLQEKKKNQNALEALPQFMDKSSNNDMQRSK